MNRRKFFEVTSAGAAGMTIASSCKSFTGKKELQNSGIEIPSEVPDYRNSIKTAFSTDKKNQQVIK